MVPCGCELGDDCVELDEGAGPPMDQQDGPCVWDLRFVVHEVQVDALHLQPQRSVCLAAQEPLWLHAQLPGPHLNFEVVEVGVQPPLLLGPAEVCTPVLDEVLWQTH